MDDVEHITSNAIQVSQNSAPKIQYPAGGHEWKNINNIIEKKTTTFKFFNESFPTPLCLANVKFEQ